MHIKEWKNKLLLLGSYAGLLLVFWWLGVPCLFQWLLHIPCPGCGMSHAVWAVLRLDFAAAFAHHPMVLSMPLLFWYYWFDGKLFGRPWDRLVLVLIAVGFSINWILQFF